MTNTNDNSVTIIVDGTPHVVEKRKYELADIVRLEFPEAGPNPEEVYSVIYYENEHSKEEHPLVHGKPIMVHEGMIFVVSPTGQS